jgi:hypothetical protein
LRDVEPLRRAAKAQLLRDCDEIAEMTELHGRSVRRPCLTDA